MYSHYYYIKVASKNKKLYNFEWQVKTFSITKVRELIDIKYLIQLVTQECRLS